MGPMTGRAAGYCAGYGVPGYMNPIPGRGFWGRGAGRGGGWGRRNWYYATGMPGWARAARGMPAWGGYGSGYVPPTVPYAAAPSAQDQAEALKAQAEFLEQQLGDIRQAISELEEESAD
jgi:hypothetical protein